MLSASQEVKLLTWVYTEGAPVVPQGLTPQDTTPMRTPSWARGPPESPEQALMPPVSGPVHTLDEARGSEVPKRSVRALAHSGKQFFCCSLKA